MKHFHYENKEIKIKPDGKKIVRKVSIRGGKGIKTVTHYRRGKKIYTSNKTVKRHEMKMIMAGKFIPGLFSNMSK